MKATDWFRPSVLTSDQKRLALRDVIFSDRPADPWKISYLVIQKGHWPLRRKLLVRPTSAIRLDFQKKELHLPQTQAEVESGFELEEILPVAPERQDQFYGFFKWPYLWTGAGIYGTAAYPMRLRLPSEGETIDTEGPGPFARVIPDFQDRHLRSIREERGYELIEGGARIGRVADFLIDPMTWSIRYFLVEPETGMRDGFKLWPVSTAFDVSWVDRLIQVHKRPEKMAA